MIEKIWNKSYVYYVLSIKTSKIKIRKSFTCISWHVISIVKSAFAIPYRMHFRDILIQILSSHVVIIAMYVAWTYTIGFMIEVMIMVIVMIYAFIWRWSSLIYIRCRCIPWHCWMILISIHRSIFSSWSLPFSLIILWENCIPFHNSSKISYLFTII